MAGSWLRAFGSRSMPLWPHGQRGQGSEGWGPEEKGEKRGTQVGVAGSREQPLQLRQLSPLHWKAGSREKDAAPPPAPPGGRVLRLGEDVFRHTCGHSGPSGPRAPGLIHAFSPRPEEDAHCLVVPVRGCRRGSGGAQPRARWQGASQPH